MSLVKKKKKQSVSWHAVLVVAPCPLSVKLILAFIINGPVTWDFGMGKPS